MDTRLRFLAPLAVLLMTLLTASASAQEQVSWTLKGAPTTAVKAGGTFTVQLVATIEDTWHVYSITQAGQGPTPTRISVPDGQPFMLAEPVKAPAPRKAFDPNFKIDTEFYEREAVFLLPIRVADSTAAGSYELRVRVRFQACDDHQCLPPIGVNLTAPIMVGAGSESPAAAPATPVPSTPSTQAAPVATAKTEQAASTPPVPAAAVTPPATSAVDPPTVQARVSAADDALTADNASADRLKRTGLLGYIWFAMGFGLLALLTPCVFPMIPITVSFFTKREEQTRGAAVMQAIVYCVGIIVSFTVLGLLLTLIAGPTGINRLAASPWMNLFLTTLFVVFALNLFGAFEIVLPTSLLSRLDAQSRRGAGFIPTLLMGLTFTLTSFTCTAAFVGTVLVAATQGEWTWAAIGMFAFSTAFAAPFFLLALFPSWLKSLPKSGGWMNSVKVVMGFLEIAAAFKFLSNVDLVLGWNTVSRSLVLAAWVGIAAVTALYLLGVFRLPNDSKVEHVGVARMLSAVLFASLGFYLLTGLFGARMGELDPFLPPARPGELAFAMGNAGSGVSDSRVGSQASHGQWLESYEQAVAQARAERRPVFLNFTGVTCTNCRWMESNMFPDPDVQQELKRFVLAELFTDRQTPEDDRNGELQQKQFGTVALPLYVIVTPDGRELAKFPGLTRDKAEFIRFLRAGAAKFDQSKARGN
jgi:thiol:disulfide interchange protein DsbD